MKHELIKTENYLLVVSDEEIKVGDYCYTKGTSMIHEGVGVVTEGVIKDNKSKRFGLSFVKIIAHLPLNGAPYLDGVDVLPEIEDEVEKLAIELFPTKSIWNPSSHDLDQSNRQDGFIAGYNKAKETYKYTEEDVFSAVNHVISTLVKGEGFDPKYLFPEEVYQEVTWKLKSLNQPKLPVAFECMVQKMPMQGISNGENINYKIKATNSEGRTEWVGKYIFK